MEERGDANVKATHAFVLLMKQTTQHQNKKHRFVGPHVEQIPKRVWRGVCVCVAGWQRDRLDPSER